MNYKLIIGGIIAYILLCLYGGIAIVMIIKVIGCGNDSGCNVYEPGAGAVNIFTTVGALVSALVISKLTITTPGNDPAIFENVGEKSGFFVRVVTWIYLSSWTLIGLFSLIVGLLVYPDVCKTLSDFGTTWLGTSVAAGWAYFGLDPQRK